MTTLKDVLKHKARHRPDLAAIVCSGCQPLSYGELAAQIDYFGDSLRRAGFGTTSKIAISFDDAARAALVIVCVSCHAIAVPLDPNLTPVELEQRLELLGVDALIVLPRENCPLRCVAERIGLPVIEAALSSERGLGVELRATSITGASSSSAVAPHKGALAFILQSSGTTAEPKLIPYSHDNMLAASARVNSWFGLVQNDRCLSVTPVYYCHGLTLTVFVPLLSGGSVAFPRSTSLVDVGEWFVSLEPTWFSASPTMHRAVLDKVETTGSVDHKLRFVVSGGAPLDPDTQSNLEARLSVPVLEHYGATEAAQISSNQLLPGTAKAGTCGIPPTHTVKIVGEDGSQLAPGNTGEILVSGPTVIAGYLNASDVNEAAFDNGWFRTGDIGSIDADGFLTVRGRLKEIINRGGEKISPVEIEAALLRHPDVAEAAAFSLPHPRLGEDVGAAVVLRPDSAAKSADLRAFLGTQLAWFKVPRRVRILSELPRGATGKIQRRKLSEQTWDS